MKKPSKKNKPSLSAYELTQLKAIEVWKDKKPGILSESFDLMVLPLTWAASLIVPVKLVESALTAVSNVSKQLTFENDILDKAGIEKIEQLLSLDLEISDSLAEDCLQRSTAYAGTSGAALGATGVGGIPLDIGTLLTIAFNTIHKIALCYGYQKLDEQFVFAVLAAANADNRADRIKTIEVIQQLHTMIEDEVIEEQMKGMVISKVVRAGCYFSARGVAKGIGKNLARRKVLQIVPLVGAVFGGVGNVVFISDVSIAARHLFQQRWLIDNGRIENLS